MLANSMQPLWGEKNFERDDIGESPWSLKD